MKRVLQKGFLFAFITALLLLGACGTKPRFSGDTDELLQAYCKEIETEGYTYSVYHAAEVDQDTPELQETTGIIRGPSDGFSGSVYVVVEETEKGVRSISLGFNANSDDENIDQITYLSGTLMQVCDASNGSGKAAAARRARAVIAAADQAQTYEKNGFSYSYGLYSSGVHFEATFPPENYALSAKELAAAKGRDWSDLGIAKSDFIDGFNKIFDEYGYSLEHWDVRYGDLDLEQIDLLAVQPEIFAIMNKAGFVDGALLLYVEGETIYRVDLLETSNYPFYLGMEDEAKLLIPYFDSAIKEESAGDAAAAADALMHQIMKAHSLEQNGIAYSYPDSYFDKTFTIEAAQP